MLLRYLKKIFYNSVAELRINNMYKYNPFIMQNIRANTLIIGANNNPINKKVRLNADFSINYKKTALLFAHL